MWVNKMKIGRIALVATALFASPAMATTYWLGTGEAASDDNAGTSKEAPFASWNAAFTAAGNANNNVLNVLPGTYTLTSAPSTWGTSRNDVTIRGVDVDGNPLETAAAAAAVVIDGNGLGTIAPIRASFRTVFSGLTFRNGLGTASAGAAIYVQGTGAGGVDEQGFAVSNCVFASCTGGPAVLCKAAGGAHFVGCISRAMPTRPPAPHAFARRFLGMATRSSLRVAHLRTTVVLDSRPMEWDFASAAFQRCWSPTASLPETPTPRVALRSGLRAQEQATASSAAPSATTSTMRLWSRRG